MIGFYRSWNMSRSLTTRSLIAFIVAVQKTVHDPGWKNWQWNDMKIEVTKTQQRHFKTWWRSTNVKRWWSTACAAAGGAAASQSQHTHLSPQNSGQQGHPDIHAVFCLTEVSCPWVCVNLHAGERKVMLYMWVHLFEDIIILLSERAISKRKKELFSKVMLLTWFHWLWAADASPPSSFWQQSWCEEWGQTDQNTEKEPKTH